MTIISWHFNFFAYELFHCFQKLIFYGQYIGMHTHLWKKVWNEFEIYYDVPLSFLSLKLFLHIFFIIQKTATSQICTRHFSTVLHQHNFLKHHFCTEGHFFTKTLFRRVIIALRRFCTKDDFAREYKKIITI